MADLRRCDLDGAPLADHARCWGCTALAGRHHGRTLVMGLCGDCRDELAAGRLPWVVERSRRAGPADDRPTDLIPIGEAARLLGRSPKTVHRLARRGKLTRYVVGGAEGDKRGRRYVVSASAARSLLVVADDSGALGATLATGE